MKFDKVRVALLIIMLSALIGTGPGRDLHAATPIATNFSNVVWLGTNVSSWKQTANLSSVVINSSTITLNYDKARVWPGAYSIGGASNLNANPWIFVNRNGTWYAATWEWMRFGQITKGTYAVHGSHIKVAPLDDFYPIKGEEYGFMVSGLARDADHRNVYERSNIVMVNWPLETVAPCTAPPTISSFTVADNVNPALRNTPTLIWSLLNAKSAFIDPLVGTISPTAGSRSVTIKEATEFTLSATNDCGTSTSTVFYADKSFLSGINLLLLESPN